MLLQISEPGQSPEPHAKKLALGIDLGTTHSVVALLKEGEVKVIEEDGKALIPSIVGLLENHIVVGNEALQTSYHLSSIKRLMGRGAQDEIVQKFPNVITSQEDTILKLMLGDRQLTAIELSGEILKHLKCLAEEALSASIQDAVITVPAYFDDGARQATKDAAKLAGLNVLRLVNEPTAAALAYGLDKGVQGIYAIYDWGGGTFDFSLLRLEDGIFQVLATGGDLNLGGDDVDWEILKSLIEEDPTSLSPLELQNALSKVRRTKELLSVSEFAECKFKIGKTLHETELTRIELNRIARPFVSRTLKIAEQVLEAVELKPQDLQGIVLVGGSSRLKIVSAMIESQFSQTPLTDIDPDLVVAMGAAQQAANLMGEGTSLLLDVTPLSLGIETLGGIVEKIIPRNSPIPCEVYQDYTTYVDGQTGISIHVVQGERELVNNCRSLAHFELKGLPVRPAGHVKVRIDFRIDADGILKVRASEDTTGIVQEINIKPSYGLSEDQIRMMIEENWRQGAKDMEERLFIETKIEALHLIDDIEKALLKDAALLSDLEVLAIRVGIEDLKSAITSSHRGQILKAHEVLESLTEDFAEKRVRAALEKVSVSSSL
ncbi:Fe-S protein assembly chaperone HscA [Candidatus Bealeia paramacronuclearis]|uniref:Fe-S protein assembly chaperone HscA n=1 Tax=Candidatus Bealeia paramacronuclearis TaxID=1921001 RepID=A0ABZ2C6J9_9PROT|nr:Fe-S protein assembly chaperone HscA [Candidatus Bealeia paramacronuclearis]